MAAKYPDFAVLHAFLEYVAYKLMIKPVPTAPLEVAFKVQTQAQKGGRHV